MQSWGFTIIEFIIAIAILIIIATSSVVTLMHGGRLDQKGAEQVNAKRFAQEGIEAVRSIRNQSWNNLMAGIFGLSSSGGTWAFSGTEDINDTMTRRIVISDVYRDTDGVIVTSGGELDPDTIKASVQVTWITGSGQPQSLTQNSYLTNYKSIVGCSGWNNPSVEATRDVSGNDNAVKITTQGNYAYMTRESGNPDFIIYDISDTSNPIQRGAINLDGGQNNISVMGDYAYIASYSDSKEFQIVNVSNPDAPFLVGSYNAPGNANGLGMHVDVTTAYLTKAASSYHEFFIFDVSIPSSPSLLSSLNLYSSNGEEVIVIGNYAYLTTSSDDKELWIVDVSDLDSPTTVGTYNIPGTIDGQSVTGFNDRILVGLNEGGVYAFDVSNPANPQLLSSYAAGDDVEYMVLSPDNKCAFLATDWATYEFQALNIANLSNMFFAGGVNISDNINGIAYKASLNRIYLSTKQNAGEFVQVKP